MSKPAWMNTAESYLGTKEAPGRANNPVILEWADEMGGWVADFYTKDETPWCGLFAGHCLATNGYKIPKNPLGARDYAKIGTKLTEPAYGAIMVFSRDGGGHVGFYVSEDANNFHILGGNQSDMVNVSAIDKDRLLDIRWPAGAPSPTGGRIRARFEGGKTTNEA